MLALKSVIASRGSTAVTPKFIARLLSADSPGTSPTSKSNQQSDTESIDLLADCLRAVAPSKEINGLCRRLRVHP